MSAASRFRYTLVAGATAVVIGAGFTVVGLNKHADEVATVPKADGAGYAAGAAGQAGEPSSDPAYPLEDATAATASAPPSPSATTTTSPAAVKTKATTKAAVKPTPSKTTQAPTPTPDAPAATGGSILDQVLAHINAARTQSGLSAYALSSDLSKASALHNQLMIDGCGLSHQCSGEAGIGDRFSAQGVQWTSAGENIGYGSAGASDAAIVKAANGLTDSMLAEVAPDDGHKKNLLSSGFKRIGLSVVRDGNGLVWMTQDFVN
jgi:uncharacterized protein YkwD